MYRQERMGRGSQNLNPPKNQYFVPIQNQTMPMVTKADHALLSCSWMRIVIIVIIAAYPKNQYNTALYHGCWHKKIAKFQKAGQFKSKHDQNQYLTKIQLNHGQNPKIRFFSPKQTCCKQFLVNSRALEAV